MGSHLRFRRAMQQDIAAMSQIRLAVTENVLSDPGKVTYSMYEDFLDRLGRGWVCEVEEGIAAFVFAKRGDASIWALFVRKEYEGLGIGTALLELAAEWLFSLGSQSVTLTTTAGTRADKFYQSRGWLRGVADSAGDVSYTLHRLPEDCNRA